MSDNDSGSWIRRPKYSNTVCHRWDPSMVSSTPFSLKPDPSSTIISVKSCSNVEYCKKINYTVGPSKFSVLLEEKQQRHMPDRSTSQSPLPAAVLSDVFKEARFDRKRFSTSISRRESDKSFINRLFSRDLHHHNLTDSVQISASATKFNDKPKLRKGSSWTKDFDLAGGRVTTLNTIDDWTIDLSKLFLGYKFASGAHSKLYYGLYKDQPVAVKVIRQPDEDEDGLVTAKMEKQFIREVTVLSHLHHKNVIQIVGACRKPPVFCVVTEYLPGGSLRAYLHNLRPGCLTLQKQIAFALDIARGMEYLHSQGVIHRDLKPENMLLDQDFRLKVADFGIACEAAHCDALAEDPGTYRWMAPEMIKHKVYGRKVDVYSFGLVLWEMVAGAIPYENLTPIQAAFAVVDKNARPAIPSSCPPPLQALIAQCWSRHPEKRPEFWQIVKVLEEFESSLMCDGTLSMVYNSTCRDNRKRLTRWISKLTLDNRTKSSIHN